MLTNFFGHKEAHIHTIKTHTHLELSELINFCEYSDAFGTGRCSGRLAGLPGDLGGPRANAEVALEGQTAGGGPGRPSRGGNYYVKGLYLKIPPSLGINGNGISTN
jgi:hypothetical protein